MGEWTQGRILVTPEEKARVYNFHLKKFDVCVHNKRQHINVARVAPTPGSAHGRTLIQRIALHIS